MTSTSIEFELQTEQQKVHEYKGLERNSQNFLLAFPPGAYTTMRTVGRSSVLELETHLNRIKDTMRIRGEPVPTAADLLALIQHATQTTEYPLDKELKITLLCWIESNRLRLRAHCCPMPTLELANGKVSVEIHGSPRENAHAKNSQWVRDREQQSKQLHPDTHEVLLCAPQTLEIYEGTFIHNSALWNMRAMDNITIFRKIFKFFHC
jgi:branched-subunit amino acid aminotransferase/4-amino-4-deoxychorismate lyase